MKLHIGGQTTKEGWKILNIQKKDGVDFVGDLTDLSQFSDNSVEEVYASHVLEHVGQKKVLDTLKGVNRILNKDGKFYISVPDMDVLCRLFLSIKEPKARFHIMRMMFGGQTDKYDFHYFGWNMFFLKGYLLSVGFKNIERVKTFSLFDDTSDFEANGEPISLNVIAYK